jgi:hypothetical protein
MPPKVGLVSRLAVPPPRSDDLLIRRTKPDNSVLQRFVTPNGACNCTYHTQTHTSTHTHCLDRHGFPSSCSLYLATAPSACLLPPAMLEVEWSANAPTVVHRRTNVCRISDETLDTYSRLVTFEGAEHNSLLGASWGFWALRSMHAVFTRSLLCTLKPLLAQSRSPWGSCTSVVFD